MTVHQLHPDVVPRPRTRHRVVAASIAIVTGALYGLVSLLAFRRFHFSSWDNTIFEQAVKGYANLGAPIIDVKRPGFSQLGDHFSPVLALIAPVYRVFPAAQTILLAQVVLITWSIYLVAMLALRVLGSRLGAVVGVLYAVSFGLQSAVEVDFHEVAFAAPVLALAGTAYVDRRYDRVFWWSLPLLLVKEDLGLTVVAIAGVLWIAGYRKRAELLGTIGVATMVVLVVLVMPAIAGGGYEHASSLGGDRGIIETGFTEIDTKLFTVLVTVAITGLAALCSPWVLVALPTLAWRFVGDNPYYWGTEWHYSLILMPIVFVAMIDALQRRPVLRWATVGAVVVSALTLVHSPIASLLTDDPWMVPARVEAAREVVEKVPDGASVETDIALMSHLATDHLVYWLGSAGGEVQPDYLAFDVASGIGSPTDVVEYGEAKFGGTWRVVFSEDGYVLATRS